MCARVSLNEVTHDEQIASWNFGVGTPWFEHSQPCSISG
jgi:hypothetical protein